MGKIYKEPSKGMMKRWRDYDFELTDERIWSIINSNYPGALPNTRNYIFNQIKLYGRDQDIVRFTGLICKEDFIEQYNLSRKNLSFIPDYDFSLLPSLISNKNEKVTVICKNTICGVEIGKFETNYSILIDKGRNVFLNKTFERYVTTEYYERPESTKLFKEKAIRKFGTDLYDFSEVKLLNNSDIPIKIKCNTCNRTFWCRATDFLSQGCPLCSRDRQADTSAIKFEDWLQRAKETHGDKYTYKKPEGKFREFSLVNIVCNSCGTKFKQQTGTHILSKYPCPNCRRIAISQETSELTLEELLAQLHSILDDKYIFDDTQLISGSKERILTYTEISTGKILEQRISRILKGNLDPDSHLSAGEQLIKTWLTDNEFNFEFQYQIKGLIEGKINKFVIIDFILPDINYWIEFNGKQHYSEKDYCGISRSRENDSFELQVSRDNNVREYCKNNNITLIEIPYTYCTKSEISNILERILINHESPDFIIQPEIQYVDNKE